MSAPCRSWRWPSLVRQRWCEVSFFFFNDTATTEIYTNLNTLSLHDALPLWTRDFILSARVAGKGSARISVEHILPNITNLLVVQGTIQFSLGILAEAGLSYVGLGVQPPIPSWGRMLAESQTLISIAPHLALFPGFAILLTVLGLNLAGDGLRDLLDPRIRRTRR